ncbi:sulfate ABC transporter permease subunit CysW [Bacillus siamensis]|uniref:sulfate ABC transporter permease subunit CysW n=1 Tax=Bacillus siamensis TaxID=659243 RepID=UPI0039E86FFE
MQLETAKTAVPKREIRESPVVKWVLISAVLLFLSIFLIMPLAFIFIEAFKKGAETYILFVTHPDSLAAMKLTLLVVFITVPLNTLFGVAAAWAVTKYEFRGKSLFMTLIDLPFAVSPVIAGLIFVLLFGLHGWLGPFLLDHQIKIVFAVPGIVLASLFVTLPFIARELIPLMQSLGNAEEEASVTLGAGGWRTFWHVTLPNIKWGLIYGVILNTARTIGEFGAVSVVSGHIRGVTNTLPLHIEILYNEYQFTAAFAVASVMSVFAIVTLFLKNIIEWKAGYRSAKAG